MLSSPLLLCMSSHFPLTASSTENSSVYSLAGVMEINSSAFQKLLHFGLSAVKKSNLAITWCYFLSSLHIAARTLIRRTEAEGDHCDASEIADGGGRSDTKGGKLVPGGREV